MCDNLSLQHHLWKTDSLSLGMTLETGSEHAGSEQTLPIAAHSSPASSEKAAVEGGDFLSGWKLVAIVISLCLAVFCVAMDNTS